MAAPRANLLFVLGPRRRPTTPIPLRPLSTYAAPAAVVQPGWASSPPIPTTATASFRPRGYHTETYYTPLPLIFRSQGFREYAHPWASRIASFIFTHRPLHGRPIPRARHDAVADVELLNARNLGDGSDIGVVEARAPCGRSDRVAWRTQVDSCRAFNSASRASAVFASE